MSLYEKMRLKRVKGWKTPTEKGENYVWRSVTIAKACNFTKSNTTLYGCFTQCPTDFIESECFWDLWEILEINHSSNAF